jgi:vacuolar protein sorting-associated protein 13A/C
MQTYGPDFETLLQSLTAPSAGSDGDFAANWFVEIRYRGMKHAHPKYNGVDQSVVVAFASVDLMLTPDSLLELQDFALVTFGTDQAPGMAANPKTIADSDTTALLPSESAAAPPANGTVDHADSSMVVELTMKSMALSVNRRGARIASGSIGLGSMTIKLTDTIFTTGKLGSFTIEDHMRRRPAFSKFVSFSGNQVANFTFQTFNPRDPKFPGYDSLLEVTTESVRIVYLDYLLTALLEWLSDLSKARTAMEAARRWVDCLSAFIDGVKNCGA